MAVTPPYRDPVIDDQGLLSVAWQTFFRVLVGILNYLGDETNIKIQNNVLSANAIEFIKLDKTRETYVEITLAIQRISNTDNYQSVWQINALYDPSFDAWIYNITTTDFSPMAVPIALLYGAGGSVKYYTTNFPGTILYDRMAYRKKSFAMKDSRYSRVG
jgi:hypothetical protein